MTAALLLIGSPSVGAQEYHAPAVTVSTEKVRMDGVVCFSHRVTEKQTLYSICKAYGITEDALYEQNKNLKQEGLRKDSFIFIPVDKCTAFQTETKAVEAIAAEQPAGVIEDDGKQMADANGGNSGFSASSGDKFTKHTVKWYEDLDVIAEKYGISVESIISANNLKSKKLKPRMVLVIPLSAVAEEAATEGPAAQNTPVEEADSAEEHPEEEMAPVQDENIINLEPKKNVSLMLMLPLKANSGGNEGNMDFYSGALLAAREKAQEGLQIDLNVFDCTSSIPDFNEELLARTDVVIGPVSSKDLQTVADKLPQNLFFVSPMDPRVEPLVLQHENMIQAPTPVEEQMKDIINWIKEERAENDRMVVFYEKGSAETAPSSTVNRLLADSGLEYQPFSYNILEGRDILENLRTLTSPEGRTHVIIASEKEAFVNDVVRNLNLLVYNQLNVVLYGPSKFRSFETIEVDNLHKTNFHCVLTYNVDYNSAKTMSFIMKYRALFNTEPTAFAFQGYDLASYFITMCSKYGYNWHHMIDKERYRMLQADMFFIKTLGGYVNTATKRVVYGNDYSIKQL